MYNNRFFREAILSDYLNQKKRELKNEVDQFEPKYVLNVKEAGLYEYLVDRYSLETPVILEDKIYADPQETYVGVTDSFDPNRVVTRKGLRIKVTVPFKGNPILFKYRASTWSASGIPSAEIEGQELVLDYKTVEKDPKEVKKLWERDLAKIRKNLGWVERDVSIYNKEIKEIAKANIARRKKEIMENQSLISSLGIPIKKREDLPVTYGVPMKKKKLKIEKPRPAATKYSPLEPTLSEEEYENILEIVQNMALVMERSPKTFSKLQEEEIRDHFLMHLNGHYEGQATGETFNFTGKTDILIRVESKNIFISECKFWRGKKDFIETTNQLLGYTSWRDTKTAILVFNRNKQLSDVIKKIKSIIQEHENYKSSHELKNKKLHQDTILSFKFTQPRDKDKELILSVLVFDIPT